MATQYESVQLGDRYGLLTVVSEEYRILDAPTSHLRERRVVCRCDCGRQVPQMPRKLLSGTILSCGCATWFTDASGQEYLESRSPRQGRHRATAKPRTKALYWVWHSMRNRCYNPDNVFYATYGGQGATVCEEWREDYAAFELWAFTTGYLPGVKFTLDRIDVAGPFAPENCRWVKKRRRSLDCEFDGNTNTVRTARCNDAA